MNRVFTSPLAADLAAFLAFKRARSYRYARAEFMLRRLTEPESPPRLSRRITAPLSMDPTTNARKLRAAPRRKRAEISTGARGESWLAR